MLDTNAASAAMRGTAGMDERLQRLDASEWCISAITHSEIRYGVTLRPEPLHLRAAGVGHAPTDSPEVRRVALGFDERVPERFKDNLRKTRKG